jgi:phage terminase large subunit
MELNINHTNVFTRTFELLKDNEVRFIVEQGGSRSSKTYSLCQLVIVFCLMNKGKTVSIVRKSLPSLRSSVMRDFFEVMKELDLYDVNKHHKTENIYTFDNGSMVEFFSVDDEQKLRGRKRDILWANEANELNFEEFNQLNMRTTTKLLFDFNPSDNEHWLYDLMLRDNTRLIKSTYKDNPFLEDDLVKEIEELIRVDENYYKIYALGEKPIPHTRVYTHFGTYDKLPSNIDDVVYGADWGFNHPTALIKLHYSDDVIYVEEILYKSKLTSSDIVREFDNLRVDKKSYIYSDYARPEIIEELRRAGYNMKEAVKDVKQGIDAVKTRKIMVHKSATNILREYKMYSWKTNKDVILDEPIKLYDDALDALRYGIYSGLKKKFTKSFVIG